MNTRNIIFTTLAIIFVVGMVWVNGRTTPQKDTAPESATLSKELITTSTLNTTTMTTATITTNKGIITLELFTERAPKTVENFKKLANDSFYNGTRFHRVIKGFMIQGGDPLSKEASNQNRWGTGGPGYQFADEITPENKNDIGTISMANAGPNTNGSQLFINTANNNFLDTKHTVFGRVTSGMETVTAIENTATGVADRPLEDMIVEKIEVK